ncbi:MAG: hypothetical protein O9301_12295 [Leptospira sp.]|nr:hypothetical protein [Leptospira sp.]
MKVPILLIAFNRANLTRQVFLKIREYKPERLYFAVNFPRNDTEALLTDEVKRIIDDIDWNCQVKTLFRESHLPLPISVSSAISWLFENEEMGIILEDDILADITFFRFCEYLLMEYRDNKAIGMISGDNFFFSNYHLKFSYYASNYFHIWGWATWRRAWNGYVLNGVEKSEIELVVKEKFKKDYEQNFWIENLIKAFSGQIPTWDYQWCFLNWKENRISLMPSRNLVSNIGFGYSATNTTSEKSVLSCMDIDPIHPPYTKPDRLIPSKVTEQFSRKMMFEIPFFEKAAFYILRNLLKLLSRFVNRNGK